MYFVNPQPSRLTGISRSSVTALDVAPVIPPLPPPKNETIVPKKNSVKTFGQNVSVKTFGQNVSVKTFGQNVIGTQTLHNFYKP